MLRRSPFVVLSAFVGLAVLGAGRARQQPPPQPPVKPPQQTELTLKVSGEAGVPPRFAVPECLYRKPTPWLKAPRF